MKQEHSKPAPSSSARPDKRKGRSHPLIASLKSFRHWRAVGLSLAAFALWAGGMYAIYFSAPAGFPRDSVIRIRKGMTIAQAAVLLEAKHMIRSEEAWSWLARLSNGGEIIAGDYRFRGAEDAFSIARRLAVGQFGIDPVRITVQEGLNSREIAALLDKRLPVFDKDRFIELASRYEGQLFPDTYFIKPNDDESDIVNEMIANFSQQTAALAEEAGRQGKSFGEILTMASIIEGEARTAETRRMVSGILWNRIGKGMKLQVDSVFPYIMEKYSLQLTKKDLAFDSPYNTYVYKGLPPGPVSNPGIDSIRAALEPSSTKYLYYLSDRAGGMHYAKTYAGHMNNRNSFLPE